LLEIPDVLQHEGMFFHFVLEAHNITEVGRRDVKQPDLDIGN